MADGEPALLGNRPEGASHEIRPSARPAREPRGKAPTREPSETAPGRDAPTVQVAGFWRRFAAGWIDLGVILPVGLVLAWIASALADVHLPPSRIRGPDFWLDLVLASDPALMTAFAMILAVAVVYLMVFQATMGRTLGMRVLKIRVIDVWGDRPSIARCAARTAGYLAGLATVMLGFLWVGFDREKRGLHDWIAGTYVIKAA